MQAGADEEMLERHEEELAIRRAQEQAKNQERKEQGRKKPTPQRAPQPEAASTPQTAPAKGPLARWLVAARPT